VVNLIIQILRDVGMLRPYPDYHYHYCAIMDYRTKHLGCDCK